MSDNKSKKPQGKGKSFGYSERTIKKDASTNPGRAVKSGNKKYAGSGYKADNEFDYLKISGNKRLSDDLWAAESKIKNENKKSFHLQRNQENPRLFEERIGSEDRMSSEDRRTYDNRHKSDDRSKSNDRNKSDNMRKSDGRRKFDIMPKPDDRRKSDNMQLSDDRRKSDNIHLSDDRHKSYNKRKDDYLNKSATIRKNEKSDGKSGMREKTAVKGACPHIRDCGGCRILKQSYEAELMEKQKTVENLLKSYCKVEPIIGMKDPNHYRDKVHVVFDHDRKGNPISGVYEEGTHRVIPIERCLIHNKKADEIIATIRGMLKSFKIKTYDEDTGYGLLRHVLIRTGYASGEIMVVLVLGSPILPSKNNFTKALLKVHPEITTIVINVNDKKTSMVLGEKEQVIYGKGYIEDSLCGKVFRISPKSFYQVNPAQTEILYGKAIEIAGLSGSETIIDAYCGTGTIGIIASDHVKKVIGVELNKDAVKDANINAKRNGATNIEFYLNDAGDFMSQLAAQNETVDIVFMDPPRTGSNEKFMDALAFLKPKKVVYVSCNPVTLERDLKYLTKKGYKAERAIPVDMFPWTEHVETCCLLYKVK